MADNDKTKERLEWLASFPSLNPNTVIEINSKGDITYLNLAARIAFPGINEKGKRHPVIKKILSTIPGFKKSKNEFSLSEEDVDGRIFEFHCSYLPKTHHVRAYVLDITERRKIERVKEEFINIVSHELRSPLALTKEGISIVLEGIVGKLNKKQKDILKKAMGSIDRLVKITNELLDVSKIESGKLGLDRHMFDARELITDIVPIYGVTAQKHNIKLIYKLPKEPIDIYADRDKIARVIINLVTNAMKFTPKGGTISVTCSQSGSFLEISVKDTGVGITKSELPIIFDKFHQTKKMHEMGEKGVGLGLAISKGIVDLHGGRIWAESKPGRGSTFIFILPILSVETALREYVDREIAQAAKKSSKVSLISIAPAVDKSVSHERISGLIREFEGVLRQNLHRAGDQIFAASNVVTVLLTDCDKPGSKEVGVRLTHALTDYLTMKELGKIVKLKVGEATYPDDAKSSAKLIDKLR